MDRWLVGHKYRLPRNHGDEDFAITIAIAIAIG
jgi:hypothetical protein